MEKYVVILPKEENEKRCKAIVEFLLSVPRRESDREALTNNFKLIARDMTLADIADAEKGLSLVGKSPEEITAIRRTNLPCDEE